MSRLRQVATAPMSYSIGILSPSMSGVVSRVLSRREEGRARRLLMRLTTYKQTLQSCTSFEGPELGMHSHPMGKTWTVRGNRGGCLVGARTRLSESRVHLLHCSKERCHLMGVALVLTVSNLAVVDALLATLALVRFLVVVSWPIVGLVQVGSLMLGRWHSFASSISQPR